MQSISTRPEARRPRRINLLCFANLFAIMGFLDDIFACLGSTCPPRRFQEVQERLQDAQDRRIRPQVV